MTSLVDAKIIGRAVGRGGATAWEAREGNRPSGPQLTPRACLDHLNNNYRMPAHVWHGLSEEEEEEDDAPVVRKPSRQAFRMVSANANPQEAKANVLQEIKAKAPEAQASEVVVSSVAQAEKTEADKKALEERQKLLDAQRSAQSIQAAAAAQAAAIMKAKSPEPQGTAQNAQQANQDAIRAAQQEALARAQAAQAQAQAQAAAAKAQQEVALKAAQERQAQAAAAAQKAQQEALQRAQAAQAQAQALAASAKAQQEAQLRAAQEKARQEAQLRAQQAQAQAQAAKAQQEAQLRAAQAKAQQEAQLRAQQAQAQAQAAKAQQEAQLRAAQAKSQAEAHARTQAAQAQAKAQQQVQQQAQQRTQFVQQQNPGQPQAVQQHQAIQQTTTVTNTIKQQQVQQKPGVPQSAQVRGQPQPVQQVGISMVPISSQNQQPAASQPHSQWQTQQRVLGQQGQQQPTAQPAKVEPPIYVAVEPAQLPQQRAAPRWGQARTTAPAQTTPAQTQPSQANHVQAPATTGKGITQTAPQPPETVVQKVLPARTPGKVQQPNLAEPEPTPRSVTVPAKNTALRASAQATEEELLQLDSKNTTPTSHVQRPAIQQTGAASQFVERANAPRPLERQVRGGRLEGAARWEEEARLREMGRLPSAPDQAPTAVRLQDDTCWQTQRRIQLAEIQPPQIGKISVPELSDEHEVHPTVIVRAPTQPSKIQWKEFQDEVKPELQQAPRVRAQEWKPINQEENALTRSGYTPSKISRSWPPPQDEFQRETSVVSRVKASDDTAWIQQAEPEVLKAAGFTRQGRHNRVWPPPENQQLTESQYEGHHLPAVQWPPPEFEEKEQQDVEVLHKHLPINKVQRQWPPPPPQYQEVEHQVSTEEPVTEPQPQPTAPATAPKPASTTANTITKQTIHTPVPLQQQTTVVQQNAVQGAPTTVNTQQTKVAQQPNTVVQQQTTQVVQQSQPQPVQQQQITRTTRFAIRR